MFFLNAILCDRPLPFDKKTLQYAKALEKGAKFPPIKIQHVGSGIWKVKDGRHRYLAHKLNGEKKIYVKFFKKEKIEK